MLRKIAILFSVISVSMLHANGQAQLSAQQKNDIESDVIRTLNAFEKYLNLESSTENDMKNLTELGKLFDKDARISNFLDPDQSRSVQIPAEAFIDYIRLNYTSGLSTNLSWDVQKMIVNEVQDMPVHSVYIPVKITVLGILRSQKIINSSDFYYFVFTFQISDSGISGFSLNSIQQNRPLRSKKTNNYLGFSVSPLSSYIYSKNIFSGSDWDAAGKFGYHLRLNYYHRINSHFSLLTGIGFSHYQSEYRLTDFNNQNDNSIERVDRDGDTYYAYYTQTDINDWNGLSFIDIPVGVNFCSSEKGLGFTIQTGLNLSFMTSSYFDANGTVTIEGYYPDYHVVLSGPDLPPDYGFSTTSIDTTGDWNLNQFQMSAFISFGVRIPAGNKFTIDIGPYFTLGLTDLVYNKPKYRDDFLNISGEPGKLATRGFGFRFELLIKL
jgi:hypothetical protein